MMTQSPRLNEQLLYQPTGDPFADIGSLVWAEMTRRNPSFSPLQVIEEVARIFIQHWDQKLHPFFANSNITHNSYGNKKDKSLQDTMAYFRGLLDENSDWVVQKQGYCRLTGAKSTLFNADRRNSILIGSGGLANFNHGLEGGCLVCKEILIRLFIMPLGVQQVGAMPAAIISNDDALTAEFVRDNVRLHLNAIGTKGSSGLLKAEAGNTTNALFGFAERCIDKINLEEDSAHKTLNLFHFSNFVNGPGLQQFTLPAPIFQYYAACLHRYTQEWKAFVSAYYRTDLKKKGKEQEEAERKPVSYPNTVLNRLIESGNMVSLALSWIKKGHYLPFPIISSYQINIRKMDKRTIEVIKRIARFIVKDRSNDAIKKTMRGLNGAKTTRTVRYELLKLEKENYDNNNEKSLISMDDVEYLFPEGYSWIEMRDLLLFGIYEQLHLDNKKDLVIDLPETEETTSENN